MSTKTYYDTLQVSRFASLSVIRAAYKALSQKHHPDKNPENFEQAHRNMKRLNEAYEVLSDPGRKQSYDQLLASLDAASTRRASAAEEAHEESRPTAEERARAEEAFRPTSGTPARDTSEYSRTEAQKTRGRSATADGTSKAADSSSTGGSSRPPSKLDRLVAGTSRYMFLIAAAGAAVAFFNSRTAKNEMPSPVYSPLLVQAPAPLAAVAPAEPQSKNESPYFWCRDANDPAACEMQAARKALATAQPASRGSSNRVSAALVQPPAQISGDALRLNGQDLPRRPVVEVAPRRIRDLSCMSTVTLNLNSSNYSGLVLIELRTGNRPGSRLIEQFQVFSSGVVKATNVCQGNYFFAFATPDSDSVSTTRYFPVEQDETQYSMPVITVTYTRATNESGVQPVGRVLRASL